MSWGGAGRGRACSAWPCLLRREAAQRARRDGVRVDLACHQTRPRSRSKIRSSAPHGRT
jgi:hypothetical protein